MLHIVAVGERKTIHQWTCRRAGQCSAVCDAHAAFEATNHMMKHNKGLNRIPDWLRSFSFFLYGFAFYVQVSWTQCLPHGTFFLQIRLRCRVKKHQFLSSCVVASYRRANVCLLQPMMPKLRTNSHLSWTKCKPSVHQATNSSHAVFALKSISGSHSLKRHKRWQATHGQD